MKRVSKYSWFVAAIGMLGLTSCLKTEEFPPEPIIAFKSFEQLGDSASLTVSFTDGDGDIGLAQSDTLSPYQSGGDYYYNFLIDVYRKENGAWELDINGGHRIPVITPTGQNKALEGEIARAFEGVDVGAGANWWSSMYAFTGIPVPVVGDTLRMDVFIYDRALNRSNSVSTGDIVLQ